MNKEEIQNLFVSFQQDLKKINNINDLTANTVKYLGAKSIIKSYFEELKSLPADQKVAIAKLLNEIKQQMHIMLQNKKFELEEQILAKTIEDDWIDLSLPGTIQPLGKIHPITEIENKCIAILRTLGFECADGDEVETPYYNFDALNIPAHHPARDMQDTFWLENSLLLRSHTTTVQARVLEKKPSLPIKIVSPGRAYRNEAVDATHVAMMHQLEAFWVDQGISFADLKGTLKFLYEQLYGQNIKLRFKPKYYPYTEPSLGVDLECSICKGKGCSSCHDAGWVTVGGAGMIHPKVLSTFGYDSELITGFAFGLGTSRMAAQKYGVNIRSLYQMDLRIYQ